MNKLPPYFYTCYINIEHFNRHIVIHDDASYVVARINCTKSPVLKYFILFIFHYLLCTLDFCRCLFGSLDNVVVAVRRTCIKCNISFLLLLDTISFLANNGINFMHNLNRDKSRSIFYFLHLLIFPFMFVRNVATYAMPYNRFWLKPYTTKLMCSV